MLPRRVSPIVSVTLAALLGCAPATEGSGRGTGKETGECYQGSFCDPGLTCLLGVCVPDDDETSDGGQAVDTGDGDGDSPGDGDGDLPPPPPTCGNGQLDAEEDCDGGELADESCKTLGFDMGALSCRSNCRFNLSDCENQPQPGAGELYSACLLNGECPGLAGCVTVTADGETEPFAGFCSNFCETDAECFAEVGGTAVPECSEGPSSYCQLDCAEGRTCPGGMDCVELQSGDFVCY